MRDLRKAKKIAEWLDDPWGAPVAEDCMEGLIKAISKALKDEREACIAVVRKLVHRPEPVIDAIRARKYEASSKRR